MIKQSRLHDQQSASSFFAFRQHLTARTCYFDSTTLTSLLDYGLHSQRLPGAEGGPEGANMWLRSNLALYVPLIPPPTLVASEATVASGGTQRQYYSSEPEERAKEDPPKPPPLIHRAPSRTLEPLQHSPIHRTHTRDPSPSHPAPIPSHHGPPAGYQELLLVRV